jgi:predicted RNase H-like HicB family nuclease
METIKVIVDRASDGTYNVYCEDYPNFFGMGDSIDEAKAEMLEGIRITKEEIGKEDAAFYPDWLNQEYKFEYKFDIQGLLEYYAGVITPTALGHLAGINPKQMWNYMHGVSKPRRAQVEKIQTALHKLGNELTMISF